MSQKSKPKSPTPPPPAPAAEGAPKTLGRKRDPQLDLQLLEAALDILAEVDFDTMTMDMVAARAQAGKATLYRRWPTKAELVRDALVRMSRSSVELDRVPDTGTLRGDLLAVLKPYSTAHAERKRRILAGLGSFYTRHQALAEEVTHEIFGRWTELNRTLMQRAQKRGEIAPHADIELACQVIVAMAPGRGPIPVKSSSQDFYAKLLDHILLPALKTAAKGK